VCARVQCDDVCVRLHHCVRVLTCHVRQVLPSDDAEEIASFLHIAEDLNKVRVICVC
jgi:hypothetical protein